jgi:hypothetical protein
LCFLFRETILGAMAMGVDIQEEQTDRYALGEFGDLRLKNRGAAACAAG